MKKLLFRLAPRVAVSAVAFTLFAGSPAFGQDGAAAAPAAAAASAPAAAGTGKALSMLPAESDVVFALNLGAFSNQQSLLSYFPRQDLEKMVAEEVAKQGTPKPTSATEAAMRLVLLPGLSAKVSNLAAAANVDITGQTEPKDNAVISGTFTKAELTEAAKSLGATAGTGDVLVIPGEGTASFQVSFPAEGVAAVSAGAEFGEAVKKNAAAGSGLGAANSVFTKTLTASGTPDVMIYVPGEAVRRTAGADPMAAMMMAPLLKADGLLLALRPGTTPVAELTASFPDQQNALLGQQFFEQGLQAIKANITASAQNIQDPAQKAEIDNAMQKINQLKVTSEGNAAKVTFAITELPDREQFRQDVLAKVKEALEGGGLPGLGGPGGPGGPPPAGQPQPAMEMQMPAQPSGT